MDSSRFKSRCGISVHIIIHMGIRRTVIQSKPPWLAVTLIIPIQLKVPAMLRIRIQRHGQIPVVQVVLAVGLSKPLGLSMVEPPIVTNVVHRSADRIKAGDIVKASPHGDRLRGKFFILRRLSHDKVNRARRLRSVHQSRSPPNKFHALHRIGWRKVIRFGITDHISLNRNTVFQDLKALQSVRIKSSIGDTR